MRAIATLDPEQATPEERANLSVRGELVIVGPDIYPPESNPKDYATAVRNAVEKLIEQEPRVGQGHFYKIEIF